MLQIILKLLNCNANISKSHFVKSIVQNNMRLGSRFEFTVRKFTTSCIIRSGDENEAWKAARPPSSVSFYETSKGYLLFRLRVQRERGP